MKHVRTHTHKLKPLNHFTVVPQRLSPLRFNTEVGARSGGDKSQGSIGMEVVVGEPRGDHKWVANGTI